ncbi:hypothetical protein Tco_1105860 [Tanacetum coccineum]
MTRRIDKVLDLDKTLCSLLTVKCIRRREAEKDKDKDEDPLPLDQTGGDKSKRGLKKRKLTKMQKPAKGPKLKDKSTFGSMPNADKTSKSKSSGKSVQSDEPEFEVADLDMSQDQEGNLGKDDEEPKEKVASKRDWFTKPIKPQEPTDPDWNVGKTPQ